MKKKEMDGDKGIEGVCEDIIIILAIDGRKRADSYKIGQSMD